MTNREVQASILDTEAWILESRELDMEALSLDLG